MEEVQIDDSNSTEYEKSLEHVMQTENVNVRSALGQQCYRETKDSAEWKQCKSFAEKKAFRLRWAEQKYK